MSVTVRIPAHLRSLTKGEKLVIASGSTLLDIIEDISRTFPDIKEKLCDGDGLIRRFITVYINRHLVKTRIAGEIAVHPGDEISILFAMAGG